MSTMTITNTKPTTMALSSHPIKVTSTMLQPPRPDFARKRSNSLPPGLANMNAQEAGMLFCAAERATARRRRPISIHTPYGLDPAPVSSAPPFHVRFDSAATIKPVPPPKDTPPEQPQPTSAPSTVVQRRQTKSRVLREIDIEQAMNGRSPAALVSTLKSLPVPVLSPTKRQVGTHSLKSYADGLFQFTQTRLVTTIPDVLSPPPTAVADVFVDDTASIKAKSPTRPSLESKFSDWSVTTSEPRQSRIQETELLVPGLSYDSSLMSPDSFFGGFDDDTPRKRAFNMRSGGYPSSEAYGPQPGEHQPLTPPCDTAEPIVSPIEEFSYFTNYDQYIDTPSNTRADIKGATEALENLAIEISPLAPSPCSLTPSSMYMQHADRSMQSVLSQTYSGTPVYAISPTCSAPSTPYQMADVAVGVPNWLIGSVG